MNDYEVLAENVRIIKEKVSLAAKKTNRTLDDIKIIAVTKTVNEAKIIECLNNGINTIGESKVQEFLTKFEKLHDKCDCHFIGHLQKNKVKYIIDKVSLIHSVDSFSLAKEINKIAVSNNKIMEILIQVNVAKEESKFGVESSQVVELVKDISQLENIQISGLMTIPPYYNQPDKVRPIFKKLKDQFDEINSLNLSKVKLKYLSMGMSGDFEFAILEGSNLIRIGSSLFGPRIYA